jgi:acyl carrier protein
MEDTLRQIVSRIGEIDPAFTADALLNEELGVDSYRAVEIVFEIEKTFSITVPDTRYSELQTFSDMVAMVRELTA